MVAEGYGLDPETTAHHLQLDTGKAGEALRYTAAFESEIRQALDENRSITAEKLRDVLPVSAWIGIR